MAPQAPEDESAQPESEERASEPLPLLGLVATAVCLVVIWFRPFVRWLERTGLLSRRRRVAPPSPSRDPSAHAKPRGDAPHPRQDGRTPPSTTRGAARAPPHAAAGGSGAPSASTPLFLAAPAARSTASGPTSTAAGAAPCMLTLDLVQLLAAAEQSVARRAAAHWNRPGLPSSSTAASASSSEDLVGTQVPPLRLPALQAHARAFGSSAALGTARSGPAASSSAAARGAALERTSSDPTGVRAPAAHAPGAPSSSGSTATWRSTLYTSPLHRFACNGKVRLHTQGRQAPSGAVHAHIQRTHASTLAVCTLSSACLTHTAACCTFLRSLSSRRDSRRTRARWRAT